MINAEWSEVTIANKRIANKICHVNFYDIYVSGEYVCSTTSAAGVAAAASVTVTVYNFRFIYIHH